MPGRPEYSRWKFVREVFDERGGYDQPYDTEEIIRLANEKMRRACPVGVRKRIGLVDRNAVHQVVYEERGKRAKPGSGKVRSRPAPSSGAAAAADPVSHGLPLNRDGKASMLGVCRLAFAKLGGIEADQGRVLMLAREYLGQYPLHQRSGVRITEDTVQDCRYKLKHAGRRVAAHKAATVAASTAESTGNGRVSLPVGKAPEDTYSLAEIGAAGKMLALCGGSLHRAQVLLKAVSDGINSQ